MTSDNVSPDASTDADLIDHTRAGDPAGFTELWHRYQAETVRYARRLAPVDDVDDVVQEAFTQTYQAILHGHGPRDTFRPYIYQAIRSAAYRRRRQNPLTDSDDLLATVAVDDETTRIVEGDVLVRAFRALAPRWREVLWLHEVEDLSLSEIGEIMEIKATAVSVLALRAREGLRQAWVQIQLEASTVPTRCRWTVARMADNSRGRLPSASQERFDAHVRTCTYCTPLVAQAAQIMTGLRAALLPTFLGITLADLPPPSSPATVEPASTLTEGFWLSAAGHTRVVGVYLTRALIVVGLAVALFVAWSFLRDSAQTPETATSAPPNRAPSTPAFPGTTSSSPAVSSMAPGPRPIGAMPSTPATASASPTITADLHANTTGSSSQGRTRVLFSSRNQSSARTPAATGGSLTNSATAYGTVPDGVAPITRPSDTVSTPIGAGPSLALTKTATLEDANTNGLADDGERITYTFAVTNTGPAPLTRIAVKDAPIGAVTCRSGDLAPGATIHCTATDVYRVTRSDALRGHVINTATVHGAVVTEAAAGTAATIEVQGTATVTVPTHLPSGQASWLGTTGASITTAVLSAFALISIGTHLVRRSRWVRARGRRPR